jgi:hypothetical protein
MWYEQGTALPWSFCFFVSTNCSAGDAATAAGIGHLYRSMLGSIIVFIGCDTQHVMPKVLRGASVAVNAY